jgi:hypothetical protein
MPPETQRAFTIRDLRRLLDAYSEGGALDDAPVMLRTTVKNGLFRIESVAPAVRAGVYVDRLELLIDAGDPE